VPNTTKLFNIVKVQRMYRAWDGVIYWQSWNADGFCVCLCAALSDVRCRPWDLRLAALLSSRQDYTGPDFSAQRFFIFSYFLFFFILCAHVNIVSLLTYLLTSYWECGNTRCMTLWQQTWATLIPQLLTSKQVLPDQILKTKTKITRPKLRPLLTRPRPRPLEVNKGTWRI